jgi:hypothetical protein
MTWEEQGKLNIERMKLKMTDDKNKTSKMSMLKRKIITERMKELVLIEQKKRLEDAIHGI